MLGPFELEVRNAGNTPANNVEILAIVERRKDEPDIIDDAEGWVSIGVLGPHQSMKARTETGGIIGSTDEWNDYCYGIIRYADIFGQAHRTKFCFMQKEGWKPAASPCSKGNDAD